MFLHSDSKYIEIKSLDNEMILKPERLTNAQALNPF